MNIAFIAAVVSTALSLATAIAHFAIARAPGWKSARAFGWIALTAGAYSLLNIPECLDGLPDAMNVMANRWQYVIVNLHVLAWLPYAFGGESASLRAMPRAARAMFVFAAVLAVVFAVTGWQVTSRIEPMTVDWAHVTYHNTAKTPVGSVYGTVLISMLAIICVQMVRRSISGDRAHWLVVAGFAIYFGCGVIELLVAERRLVMFIPGDLGFLAVVVPTAAQLLSRFIRDARRLVELTGRLQGEVRERTLERDRAEEALVQSERLAALGQLAAGVGHEINNPLTYMQIAIDQVDDDLAQGRTTPATRQMLAHARDGAQRIQRVVEGLRTYSRRQDERVPVALGDVVRDALRVAHPQLRHVARVDVEPGESPRVLGDAPRLVQALVNLLVNAAQALGDGRAAGRIVVRTGTAADGRARVEVEDDGPGVPPEHLARMSEPYFTTRAAHGGLGLGLFVTRGIVDAHGGTLSVENLQGRGARVSILLPGCAEAPPQPAPAAARPAAAPERPIHAAGAGRGRLLLVDDEDLVRELLATVLRPEWDVTPVGSGEDALAALASGTFDAVVCDLMMPGISGIQLAARLERERPELRARMLFLTGGAVTTEAQEFLERPDVRYLMKPVEFGALQAALAGMRGAARAPVA